jgi:hypothetical protein
MYFTLARELRVADVGDGRTPSRMRRKQRLSARQLALAPVAPHHDHHPQAPPAERSNDDLVMRTDAAQHSAICFYI